MTEDEKMNLIIDKKTVVSNVSAGSQPDKFEVTIEQDRRSWTFEIERSVVTYYFCIDKKMSVADYRPFSEFLRTER